MIDRHASKGLPGLDPIRMEKCGVPFHRRGPSPSNGASPSCMATRISHKPHRVDDLNHFGGLLSRVIEPPAFVLSNWLVEPQFYVCTPESFKVSWAYDKDKAPSFSVNEVYPYIQALCRRIVIAVGRLDLEFPLKMRMNAVSYQVFRRLQLNAFTARPFRSLTKDGCLAQFDRLGDIFPFWDWFDTLKADSFRGGQRSAALRGFLKGKDRKVELFVSQRMGSLKIEIYDQTNIAPRGSKTTKGVPFEALSPRVRLPVPWWTSWSNDDPPYVPVMSSDIPPAHVVL